MMSRNRMLLTAILAALAAGTQAASAQAPPEGVWIDHTGRGAVEIRRCGIMLCGHIVWLQDKTNMKLCGTKIIGDLRPIGGGKWDKGWIYSPEKEARFDVELTPLKSGKLRVLGYAGMKFLSETMIWKPAPDDLERCDGTKSAALAPGESANSQEPEVAAAAAKPELREESGRHSAEGSARKGEARDNEAESPAPLAGQQEPVPAPRKKEMLAAKPDSEPQPAKRKRQETCRLDLPYISVSFPCPD